MSAGWRVVRQKCARRGGKLWPLPGTQGGWCEGERVEHTSKPMAFSSRLSAARMLSFSFSNVSCPRQSNRVSQGEESGHRSWRSHDTHKRDLLVG